MKRMIFGLFLVSILVLSGCAQQQSIKQNTQNCGNSICEEVNGENHFTCEKDCNLIKDCRSNSDCPRGMKCVLVEEEGFIPYSEGGSGNFCSISCTNSCPSNFVCITQNNPSDNYCARGGSGG